MEILSLGEKIKRRRKELNMTLKDLAGDRITPGQISLVESGKSNPSMDLLEYLADELNTSVEYLMESEETQAEKICVFFENIAEAHIKDGDMSQGEANLEMAAYYAEKYKLDYRKAKNLYLRGIISMKNGEMGVAQEFFLSANVIFIRLNCYEEVVNTFLRLGRITLELKAYNSSCSYFQQAEKVYEDNNIGNDFLIAEIYYYIAVIYFKLENIDKSINYSYLAQKKFSQLDNNKEYAKTLLLLSKEYSKLGDIDNAIKFSQKSLEVFGKIDEFEYVSEIENSLGKLFYEFENIEESFMHLNKAKEMRMKNKDSKLIETLCNICENYIKLKNIEDSNKSLKEIMDNIENGNERDMLKYYLLKYRVDILEKNSREGENTLLTALNYAESIGYLKEAAEISIMAGKFYVDNGSDSEAAKYLNKGVEIFKKLGILSDF
ncbi:MAG: helix-turn-helix transcriptional regulator [Bacillota bacterium]|nr:helix-turn-helix transcriptional regulator [Bacillota bacterium]